MFKQYSSHWRMLITFSPFSNPERTHTLSPLASSSLLTLLSRCTSKCMCHPSSLHRNSVSREDSMVIVNNIYKSNNNTELQIGFTKQRASRRFHFIVRLSLHERRIPKAHPREICT